MAEHAVLSASSSERWLNCTAAPRFEEQFPDEEASDYAKAGTLAHAICWLFCQKQFKSMSDDEFKAALSDFKTDALYDDEMLQTAEFYKNYILESVVSEFPKDARPFTAFEVRVDLSDYIPEGFGTCDCVIIGGDTIKIVDYKHGKGVAVSSVGNTQMRLYALGALKLFLPIYGSSIKSVRMAICQPRITENVTEDTMTVDELKAWGDGIREIARAAYTGEGAEFVPGEWCRFCKGKAVCRKRANINTAFEDFKNIANTALTDEEVADLLKRAADLAAWYEDLKTYAEQAILAGRKLPGWKVVAGRSARTFTDADAAFNAIRAAGFEDAMLYDRKPKTLAALEKLCGKKAFYEICGDLITQPQGKPTLVGADDPRDDYNSAVADFAAVVSK